LWLARTDGSGAPRRLTWSRRAESGAAWSPDSRRIAFSTRRENDEVAQIYVIDVVAGGEAQRVTQLSTGARAPKWSPDGRALLFVSDVYPQAANDEENRKLAEEQKARKYNARVYDFAPIRHWDRWLDEKRAALFVQTLEPQGEARNLFAGTQLARQPGFGGRLGNSDESFDTAWTPDGSAIVFTATTNRHEWAYADRIDSLWMVPVAGGEPVQLTSGASYAAPTFSSDGRALYARMEPSTDKVYNHDRLARWSWPPREKLPEPLVLTTGFDRSVGAFAVAPDC